MSQLYTIVAIVGFSLAAVFGIAAAVMFFALRIKQVRDDLTGKTAARSIAEIRSRARTRKRVAPAAVKGLGWEQGVSSGALDAFSSVEDGLGVGRSADEGEGATSLLADDEGEGATSLLADDEGATSLLSGACDPEEDELSTTLLASPSSKKGKRTGAGAIAGAVLLAAVLGLAPAPSLADARGAAPPNDELKLSLKQVAEELEVPYGVDVAAYLSAQDIFESESDPDLSHDEIAALFEGGDIVVLKGASASVYPQPGAAVCASDLAWGKLIDDDRSLAGSRLSALKARMGLVEHWMLDGVRVDELSDGEAAARVTGEGSGAVLWAKASMSIGSADRDRPFSFLALAKGAPAPAPDGFGPDAAEIQLPDAGDAGAYPVEVYARAHEDGVYREGAPDERRVVKGQIVRLPLVKLDESRPSCDGSARIEGGSTFLGDLYASSVRVHVTCADGGGSGLASATLEYGDNPLSATVLARVDLDAGSKGAASLDLPFPFGSEGTYSTSRLYVGMVDVAGNAERVRLTSFSDAQGVPFEGLARIVLSSTPPTVSLDYVNEPDAVAGFYRARTAVVRIVDDMFETVRERYEAMTPEEQAAEPPVIELVNESLPADDPERVTAVAIGDVVTTGGVHEARLRVDVDGRYRLADEAEPSYRGMVDGLGSRWANGSDTAPFAIDLVAPEAGRVTVGPGENVQHGVLFVAGEATVEIELGDGASGIDEASVSLEAGGVEQPVSFRADGAGGGTAVWRIPATDALVDLADVTLSFADRMGNRAEVADLAAYADKNLDAVAVFADGTAPDLSVAFDNDDVALGSFYRAGRTATVTLVEASFGFVKEHEPERAVVVRRHDGAVSTVVAEDFENPSGDGLTWVAEVPCEADGVYRIDAEFADLAGRQAEAYRGTEFSVDTTPPAPGRVSFDPDAPVQWGWLFAPSEATVELSLDDALAGVDGSSASVSVAGATEPVGTVSFTGDGARGGTLSWTLPADDARINLSQVSLSFADRLGNAGRILNLREYADKGLDIKGIVADSAAPVISVGYDNMDVRNGKYYAAPRTATVTVEEASFGFVRANDPRRVVVTRYLNDSKLTVAAEEFENPSGDGATWVAEVPCEADGAYRIEADFTDPSGKAAEPYRGEEFVVDTTAPIPGLATFFPDAPVQWGWLFAPSEATVRLELDDALAGVDGSSVSAAVIGATEPVGSVSFESDGARGGALSWTLPADDARINLSQVSLSFADRLGNAGLIHSLRAYPDKSLDIEGIVADSAAPVISVEYDNTDARNGKYYNAPRTATVTVEEASFDFVRLHDPARTVAVRFHNGEALPVEAEEFENPSGDGATWVAEVPCDADGAYRIEADFTDPSGKAAEPYRGEEFVVDTVAPVAGLVSVSPHGPVRWDWLFAPSGASVTFSVSDELSGIDGAAPRVVAGGSGVDTSYRPDGPDALGGTVTWDVPIDDRAIDFAGVSLTFADKAGNMARIESLGSYENRDLEAEGLVADSAAPVISVEYDNMDARNGKYYNAPRTATVTVEEAAFGFVRANDPHRVVVTRYLNDSKLTVAAEEFENPSGDGATWVAEVPCEADGAYRIEADFTDPSGKAAEPYRGEEFVVDTTKPLIMLAFDNNEAESGGYFKAPRTATVVVYDDNFSEELAPVTVAASDAAGNAVAAPGIGGWMQAPQGTWTARVAFGEELHYAMSVACEDLAGNVAEPAEEPEFVIDMTPPTVKVEGVDDHAAYKDRVAPAVSFEDTNFEPYLTEVRITGAVCGDKTYFGHSEADDATSRSIEYVDFPYDLEVDDVYTLTARVRDKAGNESEQAVTFSVNRFGSNYELSASTAALVGSYLKRAETVSVTETNVSGLESSFASVAHNDAVRDLEAGQYEVREDGGQDAWSRYTYTFPASLFSEDGYYRVMLTSRDAAGSLSENLMEGKNADRTGPLELSFAVDGTAPVASLGNVEGSASYYAPSQRVDVYAGDNMEAREAVLSVDGATVATWDAEAMAAERAFSYELPAAEGARDVRLEVTDRAGNTAVVSAENVLVTNDLSRYVLNTPAVLYPLIAGCVVVASGGTLLAARFAARRAERRRSS